MKVSINKPCHENWSKMTPNEQGAFCLVCQKNVIDFSSKSLNQIKAFFRKKTSNESVCGRFDESQLEALTFDDFFEKFKHMKFVRKVTLILFFVFGHSLFSSAQTTPKETYPKMGAVAYKQDPPNICGPKNNKQDTTKKIEKMGKIKYVPDTKQQQNNKPKNTGNKTKGEVIIEDKKK